MPLINSEPEEQGYINGKLSMTKDKCCTNVCCKDHNGHGSYYIFYDEVILAGSSTCSYILPLCEVFITQVRQLFYSLGFLVHVINEFELAHTVSHAILNTYGTQQEKLVHLQITILIDRFVDINFGVKITGVSM